MREAVRVLADEPGIVGQREVNHEDQREVEEGVDTDREEPGAADPPGRGAEPRGQAAEEDGRRHGEGPELPYGPEPVPGLVEPHGLALGAGTATGRSSSAVPRNEP